MKTYRVNYKKVVYGYFLVKANNKKEAEINVYEGDEYDNNSEYEFETPVLEGDQKGFKYKKCSLCGEKAVLNELSECKNCREVKP